MTCEDRLFADLSALGIAHALVEHQAVFTVDESLVLHQSIPGAHTKNLFLKDAGGKFWLVTVPFDARVDLKALPDAIGSKKVSFGKAEDMERLLGVTPGSVTPLAAINDVGGNVTIILDAAFKGSERINVHPLRNSATMGLLGADLVRALRYWGHEPLIVSIPAKEFA
jgi:Ala-tRNA(Pro) deacylase